MIKSGRSTDHRDGNYYGTFLSAHEIQNLVKTSIKQSDALLMAANTGDYQANCNGHIREKTVNVTNYEQIMREFEYSRTAFLNLVRRLYDYELALKQYRTVGDDFKELCQHFILCGEQLQNIKNESDLYNALFYHQPLKNDRFRRFHLEQVRNPEEKIDFRAQAERFPLFYLEHQLRWIGKTYDAHNWLYYDKIIDELTSFLDFCSTNNRYLREDNHYHEQAEFSNYCFSLINMLPILPDSIAKDASRYLKKGGAPYPGKDKLNKCFHALEIPFKIVSKQIKYPGVYRKKTCWFIKRIEKINNPSQLLES